MLEIQNNSPVPIYEQLIAGIKKMILDRELKAGESLPSIRSLASTLDVAANTVARAYNELERDGYVKSYGVKGTFVNEIKNKESGELVQLLNLVKNLLGQGYSKEELHRVIDQAIVNYK